MSWKPFAECKVESLEFAAFILVLTIANSSLHKRFECSSFSYTDRDAYNKFSISKPYCASSFSIPKFQAYKL